MMVSETSSGKNAKRKVAPIGQISRRDRSWFSRGRIMCSGLYMLRKSTLRQYLHKAQWTERAARSRCMISNEVMHCEIKWGSDNGNIIRRCMIRSYWELHFGEQHYDKKGYGLRSEYHGMIGAAGELDCFSALIRLREPSKSEDKAEKSNVATKETKENIIGMSPATRWRRSCMRVVVGRGEEATTSPVGLSYPKVKRRLERRWTRRSTIVPQRRIYRSRRKGCRCKSTDSRAMGLAKAGLPWSHRSLALMEGEHWS
ncbi:hypothetical protein BHE74_00015780 [Ensete ventricosum]|nr:hypothetical protein BHE74_00015780 [Ensete ventricosum]